MKKEKFILILLVIGIITIGCNSNLDVKKDDGAIGEEKFGEEISLNVHGKDYDILNRSENISDLIVDLYGVDNATSIIFNDLIVVGVDMAEDREFTDEIKQTIINTVLENESMIRQVLISDNKNTFDEIETIIHSLMNGETYDDQVKDINRIIEQLKKE